MLEARNCDGRITWVKICKYKESRTGRVPSPSETNGHSFFRRPRPTKGCRANDNGGADMCRANRRADRHDEANSRLSQLCEKRLKKENGYAIKASQTHMAKKIKNPWMVLSRSQWPSGLRRGSEVARLLELLVRIPPRYWTCLVSVLCCQAEVIATGRSLAQRTPTDYGVSLTVIQ